MGLVWNLLILVAGFVMLIKGADIFVEGASKIADKFGIPQIVIGLTIVAMGTSAPEAAVSITAAMKGSAEITIGNVVGSNILNVLIILGITSTIIPLTVKKNTLKYEMPFVVFVSAVLTAIGLVDGSVSRMDGVLLWTLFLVFLIYLFKMAKKGEDTELDDVPEADESDHMLKLIVFILVGAGLIVLGADLSVDAATYIARLFGWSERLIGLTIVALGTSLPELVTSVTAGIKGKADIAIGNIVGSNIFNVLFVVGTTALITPVVYAPNFLVDSMVCVVSAALLWLCVRLNKENKLSRKAGIVMLVFYAGYFAYLLI